MPQMMGPNGEVINLPYGNEGGGQQGPTPLPELRRQIIDLVYEAIKAEPGPQETAMYSRVLQMLTQAQAKDQAQGQAGGQRQALMGRLGA